ncbi:MAG: hypothetical protein ACX93I_09210 [Winogradskyella sp.]|jgi:hypothetical protein|nr:hypothetical protein [Flavobacteriaceae bacterium]MBD10733.1 hypothetical protein [Flavobacteriaceae bacterium]|tara:strand:- start:3126 stop:3626 length:501 start_codon:yes stop_codon:yes gene_type:complete
MKKEKLHNINSNGFKTPDDYFQSFEDKFFERLNEKETIEGINDSGFTIPDDYFESLDGKILNKIKEKPVIKLNTRKVFYYVTGIAASLLLMVSIFMNGDDKTQELSAEMVETYFKNSDLDSYELAELLVNADILEEDFTLIETEYKEENLESYLLENTDIETILQQ